MEGKSREESREESNEESNEESSCKWALFLTLAPVLVSFGLVLGGSVNKCIQMNA